MLAGFALIFERRGGNVSEIRVPVTPPLYPERMLSERDRNVLDFEGSWWEYPGPKDRAVSDYLGMSSTRYYQALRRLMDNDEAARYAPLTVRRLRRVRRERLERVAAEFGTGDSTG